MSIEWLAQKKRFRLFTTKNHAALRLTDRIVYGFLAYRARIGQPTTKAMLAADTGLQRVKTVPEALKRLAGPGLGLAREVEGGYVALEPTGEVAGLFCPLKDGEHWSQRLAYNWYYPAKDGLTTQQNYLLWMLHGTTGHTHNQTGLERLTGLTRKTVAAAINRLKDLDFIEVSQATGFRFGVRITNLDPILFLDAGAKDFGTVWTQEETKVAGWLKYADIPRGHGQRSGDLQGAGTRPPPLRRSLQDDHAGPVRARSVSQIQGRHGTATLRIPATN